jgi:hypothetical protein
MRCRSARALPASGARQGPQRFPSWIDSVRNAVAGLAVPIGAALRAEAAALGAAERLHGKRQLDALLDDRSDGHRGLVIKVSVEIGFLQLPLERSERRPWIEDEREELILVKRVRHKAAAALETTRIGQPALKREPAFDPPDLSFESNGRDLQQGFPLELRSGERDLEGERDWFVEDFFQGKHVGRHDRTGYFSESLRPVKSSQRRSCQLVAHSFQLTGRKGQVAVRLTAES